MPEYRRVFVPGGAFFFTVVTFNRRPFLISDFLLALGFLPGRKISWGINLQLHYQKL
jgi:hypothetical protein